MTFDRDDDGSDDEENSRQSQVRKDLDDCDRTDGHRTEHYSAAGVAAACHATEGQSHE